MTIRSSFRSNPVPASRSACGSWRSAHDLATRPTGDRDRAKHRRSAAVTGGQAAGEGWIAQARRKYETARLIADADRESAYVTAYDAARFALVGVLAQQGLRATQRGGHLAVEHAVRTQFGNAFAGFATLRRRRAELEYPSYPGEQVEQEELVDALHTCRLIIDGAAELLAHLSIFADT